MSLSTMTGTASSAEQPRTIAAPIPFAPPVTRTTLFLSCKSIGMGLQIVKSNGIGAENICLLRGRFAIHVVLDDLFNLLVTCSQQAYRPIGTKHQPIRSECLENDVEIRLEVGWRPMVPVRFGHQPRQLAIHVRIAG